MTSSERAGLIAADFEAFMAEKGWALMVRERASQIVRLRMMRDLPPWTEEEWDAWALTA